MTAVLDPFILEKAPGPLVDIPDALVRARAAFTETLAQEVAEREGAKAIVTGSVAWSRASNQR